MVDEIKLPLLLYVDGPEGIEEAAIVDADDKRVSINAINAALAEREELRTKLDEALRWSESDAPLPEDAEIKKAHPSRNRGDDLVAGAWRMAQRMVSAKRSKYALVDLLSWALVGRDRALAERDRRRPEASKEDSDNG